MRSGLELDKLTGVATNAASSSSTVSRLHVLPGERCCAATAAAAASCVAADGPSEALAEMCVCTALTRLRCTRPLLALLLLLMLLLVQSCCLPEQLGAHGWRDTSVGAPEALLLLLQHALQHAACVWPRCAADCMAPQPLVDRCCCSNVSGERHPSP